MPLRRLRLVPRTALLMTPVGENLASQSGTATAVASGGGGGGSWANLPAGYTTVSDQTLGNARPAGTGWIIYQATGNNTTLTTNANEPISPSDVLQVNVPLGYNGGGGNEHQSYSVNSRSWSELYLGGTVLLSSNFDGTSASATASSGVQKLFHIAGYLDSGTNSMVVPSAFGTGTSFALQLRCQNFHSSNGLGVSFNLTGANAGTGASTSLTRGAFHVIEVQLIYNTGSSANGIARAWLNGTKVLERTDLVMNTTGSKRWYDIQLNPTHFNSGWQSGVTQYLQFGHALIAGKA